MTHPEDIMGIEVSKKATINVSADRLWSILADEFDKIGEWASGIDSSGPNPDAAILEGAPMGGRVCQVPGFGDIDETFTSFNAENRSFAFAATAHQDPELRQQPDQPHVGQGARTGRVRTSAEAHRGHRRDSGPPSSSR